MSTINRDLAPIVLFVFRRPYHTRQCLESLAKNQLADQSVLYIYSDGPSKNASEEDKTQINEVRKLIKKRKWCGEVHIVEEKENKGLGNSVMDGVTEIVNRYGKIIVLEDDLVLSPGFLTYMNDALNVYENEPAVMHVSGYMLPVKAKLPQTFFYNNTTCWGWATWARAWKYFSSNPKQLWQEIQNCGLVNDFTADHTRDDDRLIQQSIAAEHSSQDLKSVRGSNKWHWEICMNASICIKEGYCLHPFPSLVRNIGHDDQGIHCKKGWWSKIYNTQHLAEKIEVKKIPIEKNTAAWDAVKKFYLMKPAFWIRAKEKIQITLSNRKKLKQYPESFN